jgi:hypothetical protein
MIATIRQELMRSIGDVQMNIAPEQTIKTVVRSKQRDAQLVWELASVALLQLAIIGFGLRPARTPSTLLPCLSECPRAPLQLPASCKA